MTWSASCVIVSTAVSNQGATFAIADTELYVQVVTLSIQDNAKSSDQSKSGFQRAFQVFLPTVEIKDYHVMIDG